MIKSVAIAATAIALTGCVSMNPDDSIRQLGGGLYEISEMKVYGGSVVSHAARFCQSRGETLRIEGSTTQKGVYSGQDYAVMAFRCGEAENAELRARASEVE